MEENHPPVSLEQAIADAVLAASLDGLQRPLLYLLNELRDEQEKAIIRGLKSSDVRQAFAALVAKGLLTDELQVTDEGHLVSRLIYINPTLFL
jgi:hypothetical protein